MNFSESENENHVDVILPSGRRAVIATVGASGEEQVASRIPRMAELFESVREVCGTVLEAIDNVPGKKVTVEFGLSFSVESGQIVTLFAKAAGNASLKVTIELSDQ